MPDPTPSDDGTRAMPPGSGPKAPPSAGDTLPMRIGRYEIQKLLGEGAFGRVYLATDPDLDRQVAIKVPKPEGLTPDMRERFVREARATAKIHHPNVCPVLDVGTSVGPDGELPYIVMHFLAGTTLGAYLDKMRVLPIPQAVALAQKLALGVAAAHEKGVIHRDLKPQNVLYDPSKQLVLITDFGLARIGTQSSATAAGAVFGTPLYMSPEQARGEVNEVGPLSDVYALGVILYRMLTGAVPFDGQIYEVLIAHNERPPVPPSQARRGLDPRLDGLVLKALAKKPADRYPSAKAFADTLAEYTKGGESPSWQQKVNADVERRSSAAIPSVPAVPTVPPLAPKPPVPPLAPVQPLSLPPEPPAAKSNPPAKSSPPRVAAPVESDDGAIRQKVLLGGVALLLILMTVAVIAVIMNAKSQPTQATVELPKDDPKKEEPKKEDPKKEDPTKKKDDPAPPKEPPSIANKFAGHRFDPVAERRAAEWALSLGGTVSVAPVFTTARDPILKLDLPVVGNVRAVTNKGDLPPEFVVSKIEIQARPALTDAEVTTNLAGLTGPVEVRFFYCGDLSNDAVRALARIPRLTAVGVISTTRVNDAALEALAKHPLLSDIDFQTTNITRDGLKHLLTMPALRKVKIGGVPDVDKWLADLAPLTELTHLNVLARTPTDLTEAGLVHLKPFTKLRQLGLHGNNTTDAWIPKLLEVGPFTELEDLLLFEAAADGPGLSQLGKFPKLDLVNLSKSVISDDGVARIAAIPKMAYVILNNTAVGDESLRALGGCKNLQGLHLRDNRKVTIKGLAHLAGCPKLSNLDLENADIGDTAVPELAKCKALKTLYLTGTRVTAKGVQELKAALPQCDVFHTNPKAAAGPAKFDPKLLVGKWERTSGKGTWIFANGKLDISGAMHDYKLDGDKLTVDGLKITYTIVTLSDDELEIKVNRDKDGGTILQKFKRVAP